MDETEQNFLQTVKIKKHYLNNTAMCNVHRSARLANELKEEKIKNSALKDLNEQLLQKNLVTILKFL